MCSLVITTALYRDFARIERAESTECANALLVAAAHEPARILESTGAKVSARVASPFVASPLGEIRVKFV